MIEYPKNNSHAEIQAMQWEKLRALKMDARLEINVKLINPSTEGRGRHCRPDVIIFKDKRAVCIVECKSWSKSYMRTQKYRKAHNTKQITKYKRLFQVPVFLCGCVQAIEPVSKLVQSVYNQASPYTLKLRVKV